jgi:hypothetical protein
MRTPVAEAHVPALLALPDSLSSAVLAERTMAPTINKANSTGKNELTSPDAGLLLCLRAGWDAHHGDAAALFGVSACWQRLQLVPSLRITAGIGPGAPGGAAD